MMNFRDTVSRECLIDKKEIDAIRADVEENSELIPFAAEREAIFAELLMERLEEELEGFDADLRSRITLSISRKVLEKGCLAINHLEAFETALGMEGDNDRIIRNILRWAWKRHRCHLTYESIGRQLERKAKIARIIAESRGHAKKTEHPKQAGSRPVSGGKTVNMADMAMAAIGIENRVEVVGSDIEVGLLESPAPKIPLLEDDIPEVSGDEGFTYHTADLLAEDDMPVSFERKHLLDKVCLPKLEMPKLGMNKLIKRTTSVSALVVVFLMTAFWGVSGFVVSADGLSFSGNMGNIPSQPGGEPLTPGEGAAAVPVLLYHRVLPDQDVRDSKVAIGVSEFTAQMQWLDKHGYTTVSCKEVADFDAGGIGLPEKSILITFDDGYLDNQLYAYPVLKKLGMHAAVFAITNGANFEPDAYDPSSYPLQKMSFSEMDQTADVFEYGSHTNDLHSLREGGLSSLLSADRKDVLNDLIISRKLLDTDYFSYPYGQYRQQTMALVAEVGYKAAFTTSPRPVVPGDNPYLLGRYEMHCGDGIARMAHIASGR